MPDDFEKDIDNEPTATESDENKQKKKVHAKGSFCCALDHCNIFKNKSDMHRHAKNLTYHCRICRRRGHKQCMKDIIEEKDTNEEKGEGTCKLCWHSHTEDNLPNISNQKTRLVSMNVERDLWFDNQNRTLDDIAESVQNTFGCKSNPFSTKNVTGVKEGKTLNKEFNEYCTNSFIAWGEKEEYWANSCTEEKRMLMLAKLQNEIDNCHTCKKNNAVPSY